MNSGIDLRNDQIIRPVVGTFFENLGARMFKAKVTHHSKCENGKAYADLESDFFQARMEVKATLFKRYFKVDLEQFQNYRESMENPFPYPYLWYIFYSHGVENISKTYTDVELFHRDLILTTMRVVVLDFSIVERIVAGLEIVYQYEKSGYYTFFKWLREINPAIEENPRATLVDLGLDPSEYEIGKKRVPIEYNGTRSKTTLTLVVKKTQ